MENIEIWKDIEWYEWLYKVSNLWRILSNKRLKPVFLKPSIDSWWYHQVKLAKNNKWKSYLLHRIIAKTFLENNENLPVVMHLDNNTKNNSIDNLKWWTQIENMQQSHNEWRWSKFFITNHPRCNKWKFWKDHNRSKAILQLSLIWEFIKEWWSIWEAYRSLWISQWNISSCCIGTRKYAWGFKWKFK